MARGMTLTLSEDFASIARAAADGEDRSVAKQVEHWARIGRMVEAHPDLPYDAAKRILRGHAQARAGLFQEYSPGETLKGNRRRG